MQPQYIIRHCGVCAAPFRVKRCHADNPQRGKFCSRACSDKGKARPSFPPLADRFWAKVNRDGPLPPHMPHLGPCWVWTGAQNGTGYGAFCFRFGTVSKLAHRAAWFFTYGAWPIANGLHRCDNRLCVRPDHLFDGSQADNAEDMAAKGRSTRGERNPMAKLTEADVIVIRQRLASKRDTYSGIARAFGVSRSAIRAISRGTAWQHVTG